MPAPETPDPGAFFDAGTCRLMLDQLPTPLWLSALDGNPLWLNRAWLDFTGVTLTAAVASPWTAFVHPEDRDVVTAVCGSAFAALRPFESLTRMPRHDGGWRWVVSRGAPYRDANGAVIGYVGTLTDVTEQRDSRARLQEVLDHLGSAAFLHGLDGRFLYVNRTWCDLFAPDGREVVGHTVGEFFPPRLVEESRRSDEAARQLSAGLKYELSLPTAIGVRDFLVHKFPLTDPGGGGEAICGIATDLTDLHEREAHARDLERRLDEARHLERIGVLAGGVAHDFNNLLQSMLGHAGLLAAELADGSAGHENVAQIEEAARRAASLTRQLLDYAGLATVMREAIEPEFLLAEWESAFRGRVPRHVAFRVEPVEPGMPNVIGDAARLGQALTNFATNAIEALAQRPGRMVVRARRRASPLPPQAPPGRAPLPPGDYVQFEVEDDGEGMEPHVVERLWDPFFSTRFPGRGLGLPAALGIAHAHGGTIEVTSTPGAGSTFRLVLPAALREGDSEPSAM
ncbi:MAG: PAS domain-containing protein [Candidatus Eisenbacteria bacterium]